MKLRNVKPDLIKIPEVRVTSYFTDDLYAEFKNSIKADGVLEPIVCVQVGDDLYLIDGLHRLLEAKANNEPTVPVAVMPGEEVDVYTKNLFLSVLHGKQKVQEMRQVITHLRDVYHLDSRQIAEKTGLSMRFIDDLLLISSLPPEITEAFDSETLEKGKALALAKLPGPEIQLRVFYQIDGRRMTVDMVEQIIDQVKTVLGTPPPPPQTVEEAPPPQLGCSFCRLPHVADELKTMFVCADCESILRWRLHELEEEAAKRVAESKQ